MRGRTVLAGVAAAIAVLAVAGAAWVRRGLDAPPDPGHALLDPWRQAFARASRPDVPGEPPARTRAGVLAGPVIAALAVRLRAEPTTAAAFVAAVHAEADPAVAAAAAALLGDALAGDPALRGRLAALAADAGRPDPARARAIEAWGPPRDAADRETCLAWLAAKAPALVAAAAVATSAVALGDPAFRARLLVATDADPRDAVRVAVLRALAEVRAPELVPLARRRTTDPADGVRALAVGYLRGFAAPGEATAELAERLARDTDPTIREAALEALAAEFASAATPAARAALERAATADTEEALRTKAAFALRAR